MNKLATLFLLLSATQVLAEPAQAHNQPEQVYLDYVNATRTGNLPALETYIADDYQTINGHNKLATKQDELAEAKQNPSFNTMQVDEIHSLIVRDTAVLSGIVSAAYTNNAGKQISIRVRVLATLLHRHGKWQIVADESSPTT